MQKLYFSIREISDMVDEEQHILRYWEKEFDSLKPKKNRAGNRIYSNKDLFIIKSIKRLLREERKTLKEAKEFISNLDLSNIDSVADNSEIDLTSSKKETENKSQNIDQSDKAITLSPDQIIISKSDIQNMRDMLQDILDELRSN